MCDCFFLWGLEGVEGESLDPCEFSMGRLEMCLGRVEK